MTNLTQLNPLVCNNLWFTHEPAMIPVVGDGSAATYPRPVVSSTRRKFNVPPAPRGPHSRVYVELETLAQIQRRESQNARSTGSDSDDGQLGRRRRLDHDGLAVPGEQVAHIPSSTLHIL